MFQPLPDGSGVLVDSASGSAFALNATGALIWELLDGKRSLDQLTAELLDRYQATLGEARHGVTALLEHLDELGVLERDDLADRADSDLPHRGSYEVMGFRVQVASNSEEFIARLDRLNAEFLRAEAGQPDARYKAIAHEGGRRWELKFQDQDLRPCDSLMEAVSHVEWHICSQAIERRHDLLHVHGAAVAGPESSVLMPGGFGIGKTTFALALSLRGLRMLSDDVVFIRPDSWQPEPFPRSFLVRDGTLDRLAPLGLQFSPEQHIGKHLCATVLGPWDRAPGPPLRYVLFPKLEPDQPLALEPISGAEAAVELMRYSKNLRRFPRFGLNVVSGLLEHVECYALRRNDDLAVAVERVHRLVTQGPT
jgi:hypothetical protein